MKILQIASDDFFSTYGGGQVYVKNIVDEMICQHKELTVISFVEKAIHIEKKTYKGIDLYEVGNESIHELPALIRQIQPDIIHAHSHKAQAVQIGQALHIPVVVTAHHGGILCPAGTLMDSHDRICDTTISYRHCLRCVLRNTRTGLFWYPLLRMLPKSLYQKIGQTLQRLPFILFVTPLGSAALTIENKQKEWKTIADGCSCMIAPCNRIAEAMERNGLTKEKIQILPHGIPLPKDVPPFPPVQDGNIKFFYVGRICYVKGLHVLLEAFHRLKAPHAELHLIGGAGNKTEKRYEAALQHKYRKDARIIWHGKVAPDKVYETIREMHVALSPSICLEIYGLNIAEALAMGKPVLATRNGGAKMQIKEEVNGWLVKPNNVAALQGKMQEIANTFHQYDTHLSTSAVVSINTHCKQLWKIYEQSNAQDLINS